MRIDVIGRRLEVTDAMRTHAEAKAEKLLKFFDGTQQITVVLAQEKNGAFGVEIRVDVVKHDDFIARAEHEDMYAAVDHAVEKAARQLKDFKERLRRQ